MRECSDDVLAGIARSLSARLPGRDVRDPPLCGLDVKEDGILSYLVLTRAVQPFSLLAPRVCVSFLD